MNRCRRSIFFIDSEVQGALLARTAMYWMFCLFAVSLMLICWSAYTGPSRRFLDLAVDLFNRYGLSLVASLILLPIALMDVLRLSNRFVGPMARMRGALKELAAGRSVAPLHFRDDDFWREMATDINAIGSRLARQEIQPSQTTQGLELAGISNESRNDSN